MSILSCYKIYFWNRFQKYIDFFMQISQKILSLFIYCLLSATLPLSISAKELTCNLLTGFP